MLGESFFDDEQVSKVEVSKQNKKKQMSKKGKKQKHQNIMKSLPKSCFSCSTHSTDYLRLMPDPPQVRPTCKSCGFKLSGKLGYLVCPKLASCYVLCSTCKVCTANHILRRIFSLKHLGDNQLYSKDQFKCHGCKTEKEVNGMKGVWHCNVCAFSICVECMEKTEALWQEKNVSSDEEEGEWEDM